MTKCLSVVLLMLTPSSFSIVAHSAQGEAAKQEAISAQRERNANATNPPKVRSIMRDCPDCPELVSVPEVGHTAGRPGKIFFVTRFEITWKQYLASVEEMVCPSPRIPGSRSESRFPPTTYRSIADNYPVTLIPPKEFKCYLRWLKIKTKFDYRLPSPLEWEHFARAGVRSKYPWGESIGFDNAAVIERTPKTNDVRYYDIRRLKKKYNRVEDGALPLSDPRKIYQSDHIWPVGSFQPNAWGLFDVIGNAEEVTDELSPVCSRFRVAKTECTFLATRGRAFLPLERFRSQDFSMFDLRGFVHMEDQSGTVGYRLVRDQ